ncbi:hypothetical protein Tco_1231883 [Tanacetum coccineum]
MGASRIVEDQIKNTLKMEHPPRREALRLHRYEDPPESPGLYQITIIKEGITNIMDVQGQRRAEWQEKEIFYVGALNDTSTQHKSEGFQLAGQKENLECILKEILWAKLVWILISEGSLSLLKILGTKSLAEYVHQDTLYRKSPSPAFGWCSVFRMFGGTERLLAKLSLVVLLFLHLVFIDISAGPLEKHEARIHGN